MTETTSTTERLPRPRIRTGAAIWGLLVSAFAATVLWIAFDPERRHDALAAVTGLDAFGWTVVGVLAVGGILTLVALASVIRAVQRRLAEPR